MVQFVSTGPVTWDVAEVDASPKQLRFSNVEERHLWGETCSGSNRSSVGPAFVKSFTGSVCHIEKSWKSAMVWDAIFRKKGESFHDSSGICFKPFWTFQQKKLG